MHTDVQETMKTQTHFSNAPNSTVSLNNNKNCLNSREFPGGLEDFPSIKNRYKFIILCRKESASSNPRRSLLSSADITDISGYFVLFFKYSAVTKTKQKGPTKTKEAIFNQTGTCKYKQGLLKTSVGPICSAREPQGLLSQDTLHRS